jgi:hypothetical protein
VINVSESRLTEDGDAYRLRKLPYKTRTLNRVLVLARSASAMLTAVSSSSPEIQSVASVAASRRKGRYLVLISGSSSTSEMGR